MKSKLYMSLFKNLKSLILLFIVVSSASGCVEEAEEDPQPNVKVEEKYLYGEWQLKEGVFVDGTGSPYDKEEIEEGYIAFYNYEYQDSGRKKFEYQIDYYTEGDWKLEGSTIYMHGIIIEAKVQKLTQNELVFKKYEPDFKKELTYTFTKKK